jgi:hypothetical protein
MKRIFVQLPTFVKLLMDHEGDDLLRAIEAEILNNFEVGDLIQGCGGVRKMRVADPRRKKGKRGGLRVLYLDLSGVETTFLLYLYGKDEAEDLTAEQKQQFAAMVRIVKKNMERQE